jgi:CRP-like cAMP-binding protein
MSSAIQTIEIGPIAQIHALRRLFGSDAQLSHNAIAAFAQLARAVRIPVGTQVAKQGQPFGDVYLILEGALELTRDDVRFGVYGPRMGVGLLSALAHEEVGFNCVAVLETTALTLRAEDVLEVMEDYFDMMHGTMRALARDAIDLRRGLLPDAGFASADGEGGACENCGSQPLGLVERILYLRQTIGFEHSDIDQLAEMARAADEVRYKAGTPLWMAGEQAHHLLIVTHGQIAGSTPEGARFRFGPGDILGNLDTVSGDPRWFDAVASQDTVALSLDREVIVDLWEDHPEIGFHFLRMIARLIIELRGRKLREQELAARPGLAAVGEALQAQV